MDRRQFLTTCSLASGSALFPRFVFANDNTHLFEAGSSRLMDSQLLALSIFHKPKEVQPPNPFLPTVTVKMKARIARQYLDYIYVVYESIDTIYVYSDYGELVQEIPVTSLNASIKDFTVDNNGNIFVLAQGKSHVIWLDSSGQSLGQIGQFSVELDEGLNGPSSLTLDRRGNLHVVNSGTNSIKVYSTNGAFIREYKPSHSPIHRIQSLDGSEKIIVDYVEANSRKRLLNNSNKAILSLD